MPVLNLYLRSNAAHDGEALALREQVVVSHKGGGLLQVISFIHEIADMAGGSPHYFQCLG